jgi:multidrug efflux pump
MNSIIDAAIARNRTTLSILFMVLFAGVVARIAIPVESSPNIEVPIIVVTIPHEGISPEDAERLLVMPMEVELRSVEGVDELTAYAAEGSATLTVEFDADFEQREALTEVREAVDRVKPKLPSTAEEPFVSEVSASDRPIVVINFAGEDVPERVLYNLALNLRDDLEAIPDVLEARLSGQREELLEVVIDPSLLEAYQISNAQLVSAVMANNRLIAAGALDTGEGRFAVKVPGVIETARELFEIPVKTEGDTVVTLDEVATIRRTFKDRANFARVNGIPAISIEVSKRVEANLIDTVRQVREVVERDRAEYPKKVSVFYSQDQAPFAERQITELQGNIMTALALVMVVVVAALGFRSGVLVGMAIPASCLFGLVILWSIGYSFNFMVMFGMLLGLGMLIDGAIVVTEYADRKMAEGFDKREAFALAAKRMFWPVTASVATTLAAFLPLMFWPGVSGKFMRYLPVTVFTVLSGSLLYALFFLPALGALFGRRGVHDAKTMYNLRVLEDGDPATLKNLTGTYAKILRKACAHPFVAFFVTLGVLAGTFFAYGRYGSGMIFFNDTDPNFATVNVRARGNLSAEEVRDLVVEVENEVVEVPGILSLYTTTSAASGGGFRGGSVTFDRIGRMFVELHEQKDRKMTGRQILEEIRQRTQHLSGIIVEVQKMEEGPPVGKPIQIQFSSRTSDAIEPVVTQVRNYMENFVDGLRDIEDTRSIPGVEWKLTVDRAQAALFGADVTTVGYAVQLVTNGVKVGEYRPDNAEEEVDIRVRYPRSARGIGALDELRIPTPQGAAPISSFVKREAAPRVDTIQRIDGIAVEFIRADVAPGVLADTKVKEIEAWLESQQFDPRVDIAFRGANEEQEESIQFVSVAFLLALLLMFVLLVTQFNSFYQSVLILFAVVMSTAGVLLGLLITGEPFSAILTGTGVVALAGIVVNNNIVLIDTYNVLRRTFPNLSVPEIIIRTGAQRLRPVILTTVTTVFGLLPLALHLSVDLLNREVVYGGQVSSFWVPLARSIVFGLSFATLLTLIATPAMLELPDATLKLVSRWLKRPVETPAEPTGEEPALVRPRP